MSVFISGAWIICFLMSPASNIVVYQGFAAHYNYGVMEIVLATRGMEDRYCNVASTYHKPGVKLKVQSVLTRHIEICQVTDYPHPDHQARIEAKGIVIEFGWNDQLMWDMCKITYPNEEPPRACPVVVQVLN